MRDGRPEVMVNEVSTASNDSVNKESVSMVFTRGPDATKKMAIITRDNGHYLNG